MPQIEDVNRIEYNPDQLSPAEQTMVKSLSDELKKGDSNEDLNALMDNISAIYAIKDKIKLLNAEGSASSVDLQKLVERRDNTIRALSNGKGTMNMRANVSKSATQIKSESHYDQMNLNFDSFVKSAEASYVVETTAAQEAMREGRSGDVKMMRVSFTDMLGVEGESVLNIMGISNKINDFVKASGTVEGKDGNVASFSNYMKEQHFKKIQSISSTIGDIGSKLVTLESKHEKFGDLFDNFDDPASSNQIKSLIARYMNSEGVKKSPNDITLGDCSEYMRDVMGPKRKDIQSKINKSFGSGGVNNVANYDKIIDSYKESPDKLTPQDAKAYSLLKLLSAYMKPNIVNHGALEANATMGGRYTGKDHLLIVDVKDPNKGKETPPIFDAGGKFEPNSAEFTDGSPLTAEFTNALYNLNDGTKVQFDITAGVDRDRSFANVSKEGVMAQYNKRAAVGQELGIDVQQKLGEAQAILKQQVANDPRYDDVQIMKEAILMICRSVSLCQQISLLGANNIIPTYNLNVDTFTIGKNVGPDKIKDRKTSVASSIIK